MGNILDEIIQEETFRANKKKRKVIIVVYLSIILPLTVIAALSKYSYLIFGCSIPGFFVGAWIRKKYPTSLSNTTNK